MPLLIAQGTCMVKFLPPHLVSEGLVYPQHPPVETYEKAKSPVQDNLKLLMYLLFFSWILHLLLCKSLIYFIIYVFNAARLD